MPDITMCLNDDCPLRERVCCMCESSSGEICSRTVTTDDREQVVYMHKHSGRCVEALNQDKADLQQENQRLQHQLDECTQCINALQKARTQLRQEIRRLCEGRE